MTVDDDRPTTAERYAAATQSSDLKMHNEKRGDVDMLIANGWVGDRLGTLLFRLRGEFDSIRAEHRNAERTLAAAESDNHRMHRAGLDDDADAQMEAAERAALTARALIMVHLQSLPAAVNALLAFAVMEAAHAKYQARGHRVQDIAGKALEAWLDPICPACDGRGHNGGFGVALVLCARCHGSGVRRPRLARDDAGHEFGRRLLCAMDRKVDRVARSMRQFLKER